MPWCKLSVLIESDWNLKEFGFEAQQVYISSINRIRLEFKEKWSHRSEPLRYPVLIESDWNLKIYTTKHTASKSQSINRIRLEFKVVKHENTVYLLCVLIESDWNLKGIRKECNREMDSGINRIRLEFKAERKDAREKGQRSY